MPEQDKERIGGETSVTPSSDAAIEATIKGLASEITGLHQPNIVVEGESLKPVPGLTAAEEKDVLETKITSISPKLDHTHSRFGLLILQKRLKRKAA